MPNTVSAKGHTHVVMVLNMKRFVHKDSQRIFENHRGTSEFANALRNDWHREGKSQDIFRPQTEVQETSMSLEQAGFATGIFRGIMLETYTFPTYKLDKTKVVFPKALRDNFQFKTLFQRAWDRWEIYIRPCYTGFFVIRLTHTYQHQPRKLSVLAKDVVRLQESLDVPSAQDWLRHNRNRYANHPKKLKEKEHSALSFLAWVGATEESSGEMLYYPVNWKLAMEVAGLFVSQIATEITIEDKSPIVFRKPAPNLSIPLHDYYVIHHFEKLYANPAVVKRAKKSNSKNAQVEVNLNDIRQSIPLKKALVNLAEGTILEDVEDDQNCCQFPTPRWSITDALMEKNQASWNDEFCLLMTRTAIIFPSQKWRNHKVVVSSVPSATLQVQYTQYWEAMIRMVEFCLEIRVLAQLVESASYGILGEIVNTVQKTRQQMFDGDIKLDDGLPDLVTRAAHLRRLAALAQCLSHAQLWSRAEYAIRKADFLFSQLGINQTLDHIQRNIEGINSVVEHVDEWYLADLSEKSNDRETVMSLGLAAASLTLTLLMWPSFWTDLHNQDNAINPMLINILGIIGSTLSVILILMALTLLIIIFRSRRAISKLIKRITQKESAS